MPDILFLEGTVKSKILVVEDEVKIARFLELELHMKVMTSKLHMMAAAVMKKQLPAMLI